MHEARMHVFLRVDPPLALVIVLAVEILVTIARPHSPVSVRLYFAGFIILRIILSVQPFIFCTPIPAVKCFFRCIYTHINRIM